jgi:hypothetical protein
LQLLHLFREDDLVTADPPSVSTLDLRQFGITFAVFDSLSLCRRYRVCSALALYTEPDAWQNAFFIVELSGSMGNGELWAIYPIFQNQ